MWVVPTHPFWLLSAAQTGAAGRKHTRRHLTTRHSPGTGHSQMAMLVKKTSARDSRIARRDQSGTCETLISIAAAAVLLVPPRESTRPPPATSTRRRRGPAGRRGERSVLSSCASHTVTCCWQTEAGCFESIACERLCVVVGTAAPQPPNVPPATAGSVGRRHRYSEPTAAGAKDKEARSACCRLCC